MSDYDYEIKLQVRDYECDLQGIVSNANYMNFLTHARHEFLREKGIDFARMHDEGKDLVVTRAEMDYKVPLTCGDSYAVRIKVAKEGRLKFVFHQEIIRLSDEKLSLKAKVTGTCLSGGRPVFPPEMETLL